MAHVFFVFDLDCCQCWRHTTTPTKKNRHRHHFPKMKNSFCKVFLSQSYYFHCNLFAVDWLVTLCVHQTVVLRRKRRRRRQEVQCIKIIIQKMKISQTDEGQTKWNRLIFFWFSSIRFISSEFHSSRFLSVANVLKGWGWKGLDSLQTGNDLSNPTLSSLLLNYHCTLCCEQTRESRGCMDQQTR